MTEAPDGTTRACPFCASFNLEVMETPALFVVCENCGCEGPFHHGHIDKAIELWNLRTAEGSAPVDIDHGEEEDD